MLQPIHTIFDVVEGKFQITFIKAHKWNALKLASTLVWVALQQEGLKGRAVRHLRSLQKAPHLQKKAKTLDPLTVWRCQRLSENPSDPVDVVFWKGVRLRATVSLSAAYSAAMWSTAKD